MEMLAEFSPSFLSDTYMESFDSPVGPSQGFPSQQLCQILARLVVLDHVECVVKV